MKTYCKNKLTLGEILIFLLQFIYNGRGRRGEKINKRVIVTIKETKIDMISVNNKIFKIRERK